MLLNSKQTIGLYKPYKEIKLETNNQRFTGLNNVVNG